MDDLNNAIEVQVPGIELANVSVSVARNPNDPTQRIIVIGPIFLTLPLDDDARRAIVKGLTGVDVAQRMDLPKH